MARAAATGESMPPDIRPTHTPMTNKPTKSRHEPSPMARLHDRRTRGAIVQPFSVEPVTLIEEVFPQDTNAYDTLFGGRLLSLMDKAGGIACAKFAHREFVTISIDTLTFIAPARQGDLLEVTGQVVFTSTHTACVKVTAQSMSKSDWERRPICEGYFFFVAIDSMMRPIPIPQLTPEGEAAEREWAHAEELRANMLRNRAASKA